MRGRSVRAVAARRAGKSAWGGWTREGAP
jgi:hypothetical protein